ncbi:MAG: hypothetical protein WB723_06400 [Candidatus Acidiferrales bacterium]
MNKILRWTAIVIAGFAVFFNLPTLIYGSSFVWEWVRVHTSDGPYFRWSYLLVGLVCLLISGLGLGLAARAICRKRFCVVASVAALLLGLGCAVILPDVGPQLEMASANQRILGHADHSLSDWDEAHGKFPSSEEELREALAVRPLQEPAIYFQQGRPIPYDVRIVTNAAGPATGPLPPRPGTVVYAVSLDYKEYWLTMTTLRNPTIGPVAWEHVAGVFDREPIWVMHRTHHNPGEGYQPFIE